MGVFHDNQSKQGKLFLILILLPRMTHLFIRLYLPPVKRQLLTAGGLAGC
jgi:hypothetical protein